MKSKEELAEIARKNGAKSKGPKTAPGKEQSKRNAITHGDRATALKLLVPPHSAILAYEDRREFHKLYDTNIAKYLPLDHHAHRPILCCPCYRNPSPPRPRQALLPRTPQRFAHLRGRPQPKLRCRLHSQHRHRRRSRPRPHPHQRPALAHRHSPRPDRPLLRHLARQIPQLAPRQSHHRRRALRRRSLYCRTNEAFPGSFRQDFHCAFVQPPGRLLSRDRIARNVDPALNCRMLPEDI